MTWYHIPEDCNQYILHICCTANCFVTQRHF